MMLQKTIILGLISLIFLSNICCTTGGVTKQQIKNNNMTQIKPIGFQLSPNEIDPNVSPVNTNTNIADVDNTVSNSVEPLEETNPVNVDDANPINKFCKCKETLCNCCRDFSLPFVPVRGPACAKINYLGEEKMAITIKYGDIVVASRTVSGKNAEPICMPMPGGFSRFCGRIYGLSKGKDDFKACLGLELRAEDDIEAALRVSCFKFGTKGLSVVDAEPLPPVDEKNDEDEEGFFGFGGDDGDDEGIEESEEDDVSTGDDDDDQGDFRWLQYIWK